MTAGFSYEDTITLLDDLWSRPIVPAARVELLRAGILLRHLGNPHRAFRCVHIAGSSGKGSTTTMVGSILQQAGNRTGYFRSPHLHSYTERIAINDADISEPEWLACFETVWPIVTRMIDGTLPGYSSGRPSFFEVLFAMAVLHFQRSAIEWAAMETGMGGRLDATNTLNPDVAAVTNVSLEHTRVLGSTVRAIATEKAAIIKSGMVAVTAADGEALDVVRERAATVATPLIEVPRDVSFDIEAKDPWGNNLTIRSAFGLELSVSLPLAGRFQATNAATAVAAMLGLRQRGVEISDKSIVSGLERARVPGRFEVVSRCPLVILDGAHNPAAAAVFSRSLEPIVAGKRVVLLFAAMKDKDVTAMASSLAPLADVVVLTTAPDSPRARPAAELEPYFHERSTIIVDDPAAALERALEEVRPDDVLVVCGSLYLVGFARTRLMAVRA